MRVALVAILGLVIAVAVVVGGWQLGWWLKEETVNRNVQIDNRNLGTQTAWRDEAYDNINKGQLLSESSPARQALEQRACELIGRLTPSYQDEALLVFYEQECA